MLEWKGGPLGRLFHSAIVDHGIAQHDQEDV